MNKILHITSREQWGKAQNTGTYQADSLQTEGFIHCSTLDQLIKSADRFFRNQRDLVILVIDSDRVQPEIRYEGTETDNLFPHIYGELNIDAVVQAIDLDCGENGLFVLPTALQT